MREIVFLAAVLLGNTLASADERDILIAQLRAEISALKVEIATMRQPTTIESKIVMESIVGCDACDRWWAGERMELQRAKWQVQRVEVQPRSGKLYPRWRVCIGDACEEVENTRSIIPRLRQIIDNRQKRSWELFQ